MKKKNNFNKPQRIGELYITDNPSDKHKAWFVKEMKNLLYAHPQIREGRMGYEKMIDGKTKRPINGSVKIYYTLTPEKVEIGFLESYTKNLPVCETTSFIEYHNFSYTADQKEYNFFPTIENNYKQDMQKKAEEKRQERMEKKRERIKSIIKIF